MYHAGNYIIRKALIDRNWQEKKNRPFEVGLSKNIFLKRTSMGQKMRIYTNFVVNTEK